MDVPPPLPPSPPPPPPPLRPVESKRSKSSFHTAASLSLVLPLMAFCWSAALRAISHETNSGSMGLTMLQGVGGSLLIFGGLAAGVYALFGIRKYGNQGILVKSLLGLGLFLLFALAAAAPISHALARAGTVEGRLKNTVRLVNAQKGKTIDDSTTLDGAELLPGNTLVYIYVVSFSHDDVSQEALERILRPKLEEAYKTHPDLKFFREHHLPLVYRYKDSQGQLVGEIKITPQVLE